MDLEGQLVAALMDMRTSLRSGLQSARCCCLSVVSVIVDDDIVICYLITDICFVLVASALAHGASFRGLLIRA